MFANKQKCWIDRLRPSSRRLVKVYHGSVNIVYHVPSPGPLIGSALTYMTLCMYGSWLACIVLWRIPTLGGIILKRAETSLMQDWCIMINPFDVPSIFRMAHGGQSRGPSCWFSSMKCVQTQDARRTLQGIHTKSGIQSEDSKHLNKM